ncbi:MAG: amidohydrolase family protein [Cyclobacteriaceae bacterium]|nr:amidohydrolase family protein [Cyclobacteriaceae bacterium SS2]
MPEEGFQLRIKKIVDSIELVDTHEHLMAEQSAGTHTPIDFMLLLAHYADDDIKSAGMSKPQFAELLSDKYAVTEKWEIVKPYWEASKNTTYNRAVLLAIDELFDIGELNDNTVEVLSEKLRNSYDGTWYDYVLKEKAKIKYAIQDVGSRREEDSMFRYVEKFDQFIRIQSKQDVLALEKSFTMKISNLDSYVDMLTKAFEQAIERGIVGVKSALAYHRPLNYENVTKEAADKVFSRLMESDEDSVFSFEEAKPFQDFIMHQIIQLVRKHDLPFQFHTGLQSGDGNIIDNANPSHLANLFLEYRDVRFVLFHGGFPYGGILSTQAKSFRNVYIDMCWSAVISPSYSERYLHEWIETVPSNKIMAFGGDYHNVESTFAHSLIARGIVSKVLIEKVGSGYLTEAEALEIAKRILHDNAIDLFKIE